MKPINSTKSNQTDTVQATIATSAGCNVQTVNMAEGQPFGGIHIDRIRITAPCTHVPTGKILYFDDESLGRIANAATANQKVLKDGGEKAYIRSKEINARSHMAGSIEIHCCPPLVLQKHNLFGHGNLQAYVYAVLDLATERLGIDVEESDRQEWQRGGVSITEIHLTGNFGCPYSAILPIIQAVDDNNACGKQRSIASSITLGFSSKRRSTYHALTIYDKMLELMTHWSKKPGQIGAMLIAEASKGIRAEVKLYSQEIKSRKLGRVMRWQDVDIVELFFEIFNKHKINYSIQRLLTDDELACLTRAERNAYTLWLKGVDIEDQCCRTTAWKHTKSILDKTGVDISGNRRPEALPDIDLMQIFTPGNLLPVPAWAIGTKYYFPSEPSMFERALRALKSMDSADELDDGEAIF